MTSGIHLLTMARRGKMALTVCYWNSISSSAGGENGSRVQIAHSQTNTRAQANIYFPLRLISRASKQCTAQISAINHTTRDQQRRRPTEYIYIYNFLY